MGRRIRTRLYFTSESHLHTVLSVLRFANVEDQRSLLSENGIAIINSTPELCYLTQLIMRVFEDSRRDIDDPRRFRVEIMFSPGATATPFHMHELHRDADSSRLDTAHLQMIGREGLTCQDVEDFFEKAIMAGKAEDDLDSYDVASTTDLKVKNSRVDGKDEEISEDMRDPSKANASVTTDGIVSGVKDSEQPDAAESNSEYAKDAGVGERSRATASVPETVERDTESDDGGREEAKNGVVVGRKYFWSTVAVGSFVLGVSCLVMALNLSGDSRHRRRWSRKY